MKLDNKTGRVTRWLLLVMILGGWGCATISKEEVTLPPPNGAVPLALQAMQEGNRLFKASQWPAAKAQYEAALKAQPAMAEAHYNLAVTLERLGDQKAAYDHYIKAANLAPGHKIIWNSPPLRKHGEVQGSSKSDMIFAPAIGH